VDGPSPRAGSETTQTHFGETDRIEHTLYTLDWLEQPKLRRSRRDSSNPGQLFLVAILGDDRLDPRDRVLQVLDFSSGDIGHEARRPLSNHHVTGLKWLKVLLDFGNLGLEVPNEIVSDGHFDAPRA
jgi:hypothetical protein